ncbi:activating transcription factor of chaperone [Chironomus tepperi]|uniref:activating transcription factor of chaperone n=1 Tax=Chironomus tepperi TaxID=113505 RepID=UPI00391FBF53
MESSLIFEQMVFGQQTSMTSPTEELIFEDNFANEIYMKYVDESTGIDLFAEMERDEKTYLDDLQSITSKIDLPIDDFVASIENADDIIEETLNLGNIKNDQLLMEFNSILDAVEIQNQLTPPQTPPYHQLSRLQEVQQINTNNIPVPDQYQIFSYQQQPTQSLEDQFVFIQNGSNIETSSNDITVFYENTNQSMISNDEVSCHEIVFDPESIISSPTDIQRELEVVDELVRAHSRQNFDYDDNASLSASSSAWSPRSEYSSSGYSQYGDEPVKKSSGLRGVSKKRPRGYGRNPEEKKSRKKEQNKNAATRYRIKKKQEVEVIMDEEKILMDKNRKLTTTYKDTKREVKYLKSLLRDLFKARGFI